LICAKKCGLAGKRYIIHISITIPAAMHARLAARVPERPSPTASSDSARSAGTEGARPAGRGPAPAAPASPPAGQPVRFVSMYAKRREIYPRAVTGWFATRRWVMVWVTQLVFYGLPWLQWNGRQAFLFDLGAQRFYLLGLVLYPQDLIYRAALMVIAALVLFLFTAVAGRLWCGYACPQTVYTEIYLWIARRIEGDRVARMRLDQAPWTANKVARKSAKQLAWLAVGLYTGFTFVGYFTPIKDLAVAVATLSLSAWEGFWILFYGLATYGNAGYLREQMCTYMCPYARIQSTLIDGDSLIITYDRRRGEPRSVRSRKPGADAATLGDCVDCKMCVQVCPTGIDIRDGLQNECIGCAACIDVCNEVMARMGFRPNLVGYVTENGVNNGWTRRQMILRMLRPRVLVYGGVLLSAALAFVVSVGMRPGFAVDVIKDRGALARVVDNGDVENVYRLQIMNRTESPQRFAIGASGLPGLALSAPEVEVPPAAIQSITVALRLPADTAQRWQGQSVPVNFEVTQRRDDGGDPPRQRETSRFVVPR
jgi:cytochrome c oxidase accessory protein FixG